MAWTVLMHMTAQSTWWVRWSGPQVPLMIHTHIHSDCVQLWEGHTEEKSREMKDMFVPFLRWLGWLEDGGLEYLSVLNKPDLARLKLGVFPLSRLQLEDCPSKWINLKWYWKYYIRKYSIRKYFSDIKWLTEKCCLHVSIQPLWSGSSKVNMP